MNENFTRLIIKIKLKEGALLPIHYKQGDWYDIFTCEETVLKKGEYKQIPLGVAMELPKGYEAIVAPRSSTFKRFGCLLANSIGIIDEAYKGNDDYWCFPVYATRDAVIPKNIRICQFRIIEHQPLFDFSIVDRLGENRGGFGSTGM